MQTAVVQHDDAGYEELTNNLLARRAAEPIQAHKETSPESNQDDDAPVSTIEARKMRFTKGDQSFDVDEDAEIEMMADKKSIKLSLKELRDRAAGDIAVKNRMHSLSEEKKKVSSTFKEFARLAEHSAFDALEYIAKKAQEAGSEFEYEKYLQKLGDEAEKLSQMDDKEKRAYEAEKKVSKQEEELNLQKRQGELFSRKQEILTEYPEVADQFEDMLSAVLDSEDLMHGVTTEMDVMNRVESLIEETCLQRDIIHIIKKIDPSQTKNNELIFALSDQIKANPDLDESDVKEIIEELIRPVRREPSQAQRRLSQKQLESTPISSLRSQGASEADILAEKLAERRRQRHEQKIKRF